MSLLRGIKDFLGFEDEDGTQQKPVMPSENLRMTGASARIQQKPIENKAQFMDFALNKKALRKPVEEIPAIPNGNGILIVEPRSYEEDSRKISAHLKAGYTVMINLKYLDLPTGKRLMDFVCGTVYAFDGRARNLGGYIYLCAPSSVNIIESHEEEPRLENQYQQQEQPKYYEHNTEVMENMYFQAAG